jgi:phosphoglycolate phosphatase
MRAIVFDLDGTLIDSLPDLAASVNVVLAARGLPALPSARIEKMIGDGARMLVTRAFAASGAEMTEADLDHFLNYYTAHAADETAPYPGIEATLQELHAAGHKLAVCTNKPAAAAREVLAALNLDRYFATITGGDSTQFRKPDPRHLAATLESLGTSSAVMIGDHHNDMAVAAGCNIPGIFAAWGYGHATSPYIANAATELPGIIRTLPGAGR